MKQEEIAAAITKYVEENHPAMSELSNWIADNNISKFDLAMTVIHQHTLLTSLEKVGITNHDLIEAAEQADLKRIGYKVREGGEVFPPIKEDIKRKRGRPRRIKETVMEQKISVRISKDEHDALRTQAQNLKLKVSDMCRLKLADLLKNKVNH